MTRQFLILLLLSIFGLHSLVLADNVITSVRVAASSMSCPHHS